MPQALQSHKATETSADIRQLGDCAPTGREIPGLLLRVHCIELDPTDRDRSQVLSFNKHEIMLGSGSECDIVLPDPSIDAKHCTIALAYDCADRRLVLQLTALSQPTRIYLEDSLAALGVPVEISPCTRILIGRFLFRMSITNVGLGAVQSAQPLLFRLQTGHRRLLPGVPLSRNTTAVSMHQRYCHISGSVFFKERPLAGVRVEVNANYFVQSDLNGNFIVENLLQGSGYSLSFKKAGFTLLADQAEGVLCRDTVVRCSAQRSFTISGRVTHKGGDMEGVRISAGMYGHTYTDRRGWYCINDIPEGSTVHLKASLEGFKMQDGHKIQINGRPVHHNFEAIRLVTISGRVVHHGKAMAGVIIDGGDLGVQITTQDGFYQFKDIAEHTRYKLKIHKPGFRVINKGGRRPFFSNQPALHA